MQTGRWQWSADVDGEPVEMVLHIDNPPNLDSAEFYLLRRFPDGRSEAFDGQAWRVHAPGSYAPRALSIPGLAIFYAESGRLWEEMAAAVGFVLAKSGIEAASPWARTNDNGAVTY